MNNDGGVDNARNPADCPASKNPDPASLVIGKCSLDAGASKGGACQFVSKCDFNIECTTACCSRESTAITGNPGPGLTTGVLGRKCIAPASVDNPINPYLCKP